MQRLTGLDAGFLYMETPTSFMHVAGLIVVDPSTSPDTWGFEKVKELYRARLDLAPPFRRRLVEVPFGLHHPLWIEDPDFDLDWHLRHIAVPPPGRPDQINELVAHLVAIPLDRSRPLWETWVIEGLEGGRAALLSKVHHSAIDGASGEELMVAILDLGLEIEDKPGPEIPWTPDHVPTDTELVGHALASLAQQPVKAAKTVRRTVETALQLRDRYARPDTVTPRLPLTAPYTSFNHALTPHRSFGASTISLSRVKAIKKTLGCTVNDVLLTLCGGALRSYLDECGEQPEEPLIAMVPVSVRAEAEQGGMGNKVSTAFASLATDLDDPVDRVSAVHASMGAAKEAQELIGADTLQDWIEFAAPVVAARAARVYSRMKVADRHRPLFNVTISNVPGPPFPLYVAGAEVESTNPIGPIFDGAGLNMTVMSYQDRLDFGLLACPELLEDVQHLADLIGVALDDLEAAVARHESSDEADDSDVDEELAEAIATAEAVGSVEGTPAEPETRTA
jgi:WS/DGAT/MGAT family acyltransferase